MKRSIFVLLALCAPFLFSDTASAVDCKLHFVQNQLCADIAWEAGPKVGKENKILLQFFREDMSAAAEPQGALQVSLFMPGMGHGSGPTTISRPLDSSGNPQTGLFEVSKMHFMMGGEWEVRFSLKQPSGTETVALPLNL